MGISFEEVTDVIPSLVNMHRSHQSRVSFALENPEQWSVIEGLRDSVARRNALTHEHPIDSLISVLEVPSETYSHEIEDEALPRFVTNSLVVSLIQIGIMLEDGWEYASAIGDMYDRGFFAWMSSNGRHAASDDYDDVIAALQRCDLWYGADLA